MKNCSLLLVGLFLSQAPVARAGWSGSVNGVGAGSVAVSISSSRGGYASKSSGPTTYPSTSMPGGAPSGTAGDTYASAYGQSGYIVKGSAYADKGDSSDNDELNRRHITETLTPSKCAKLDFDAKILTYSVGDENSSGTIAVNAKGTTGTAFLVQGFELNTGGDNLPVDIQNGGDNEAMQYIQANQGVKLFEMLIIGPFNYDSTTGCPLIIPFTLKNKNLEKFVLLTDAVAISEKPVTPLFTCPSNKTVEACGELEYPTFSYNPNGSCSDSLTGLPDYYKAYYIEPFPGKDPTFADMEKNTPVKMDKPGVYEVALVVTDDRTFATDSEEERTSRTGPNVVFNCVFEVTVEDSTAPTVSSSPADAVIECPAVPSFGTPTFSDCDASLMVSSADTTLPVSGKEVSKTRRTWTATDHNGKFVTTAQTITVQDTTAPTVSSSPADAVIEYPAVPSFGTPTFSDTCDASLTVTFTDTTLVVSGKEVSKKQRTWTATDDKGNFVTTAQTITVQDNTAPVAPTLPDVKGGCSGTVTLTAPKTTDNCDGQVTGTTTDPVVYNTIGTYTVLWKFKDAAGNFSTANQKVVISGLVFEGFKNPIDGADITGGSCSSPKLTKKLGSNIPVKFEVECGDNYVVTGQPTMSIERSNSQCTTLTSVTGGNFVLVGNEWHFNWNTTGLTKANYKLTATLQDGSKQFVWIRLN